MADSRFFTNAGSLSLSDIASLTGATLSEGADGAKILADVASLEQAGPDHLSFFDNIKYLEQFTKSKAGACFVRPKFAAKAPKGMAVLITEEPYTAYALAAQRFYPESKITPGISPQAFISKSASIGKNVRIDAGAWIGEKATICDGCHIGANSVIGDNVEIGEASRIGPLVSISHSIIGKRAIIHPGVHIGQDGFGFAPGPKGIVKVPQLGRVIIGSDVEIGAGTCIDRGAGPDTTIGDFTKIDNQVQIGHNVRIGRYVIITGQCGIAGSTVIEDGVMMGAQGGAAGHVTIGAGAKLASRSGVMRDVPAGETYGGAPAIPIKEWHRQTAALIRLSQRKED